ncbi:hypothetical protein Hanom_Chr02g00120511 [Helianthus anomalus]
MCSLHGASFVWIIMNRQSIFNMIIYLDHRATGMVAIEVGACLVVYCNHFDQ